MEETIGQIEVEIEIEVDGERVVVSAKALTGSQIKNAARKPPGNLLFRLEHRKRIPVGDDEVVHLREDEKFVTQPPVGGTS